MGYILVGIGGMLGSITRYKIGKYICEKSNSMFPLGTFIINISGALMLGIVSSFNSNNYLYTLFGDGFLGAYTTFSTFMYEGFNLYQDKEKLNAFIYIISSIFLGIIGFWIGSIIGHQIL